MKIIMALEDLYSLDCLESFIAVPYLLMSKITELFAILTNTKLHVLTYQLEYDVQISSVYVMYATVSDKKMTMCNLEFVE